MHSPAASNRHRLSETEPSWFVFETSCYAFGGVIRRFAKVNVNKVKVFLLYQRCEINCSKLLFQRHVPGTWIFAKYLQLFYYITDIPTDHNPKARLMVQV